MVIPGQGWGLKTLIWTRHLQVILTVVSVLREAENSFLLFLGTAQLSIDCAEMIKCPAHLPAWSLPRHLQVAHYTCTHIHTPLPSLLVKKNCGFDLALKSTVIIYSISACQEIQIWTVLIKGQVWFLPIWWMWVRKAADRTDGSINGIASSSRGLGMRESNALALQTSAFACSVCLGPLWLRE